MLVGGVSYPSAEMQSMYSTTPADWTVWHRDSDETVYHIIIECSKLAQKKCKTWNDWVGKGDLLGIVQEIKIWAYTQLVYAQTRFCQRKCDAWNFQGIQTNHLIPARKPDLVLIKKKEKERNFCHLRDFIVLAEYRMKMKDKEKIKKYFNFARDQENLWIMKVTVIPITVGTLGTVLKILEKILAV